MDKTRGGLHVGCARNLSHDLIGQQWRGFNPQRIEFHPVAESPALQGNLELQIRAVAQVEPRAGFRDRAGPKRPILAVVANGSADAGLAVDLQDSLGFGQAQFAVVALARHRKLPARVRVLVVDIGVAVAAGPHLYLHPCLGVGYGHGLSADHPHGARCPRQAAKVHLALQVEDLAPVNGPLGHAATSEYKLGDGAAYGVAVGGALLVEHGCFALVAHKAHVLLGELDFDLRVEVDRHVGDESAQAVIALLREDVAHLGGNAHLKGRHGILVELHAVGADPLGRRDKPKARGRHGHTDV